MKAGTHVVVTTEKRGVFGGVIQSGSIESTVVTLSQARMCFYWSAPTKGVLGLAAIGPQDGSRVTAAIPSIELNGVTAIMEATPTAVAKWEEEAWAP